MFVIRFNLTLFLSVSLEALENVPLFCYPDGEEAANTKNVS